MRNFRLSVYFNEFVFNFLSGASSMKSHENRVIVFVDIRGFTKASEKPANFLLLPELLYRFFIYLVDATVKAGFDQNDYQVKSVGDGAMFVFQRADNPSVILDKLFKLILDFEKMFYKEFNTMNRRQATTFEFGLGWGVARGPVYSLSIADFDASGIEERLNPPRKLVQNSYKSLRRVYPPKTSDFFGSCINFAKRLCDEAKPHGIVLALENFASIPDTKHFEFERKTLEIKGLSDPVEVWFGQLDIGAALTAEFLESTT